MSARTCAVCTTPSAAVGSSRIRTRGCVDSERAIATACRCPPDSEPTCARGVSSVVTESEASSSRVRRSIGGLVSERLT